MNRLLRTKDFPFMLTLLFGLVGYQLNEITSRIIHAPVIEYHYNVLKESDTLDKVKRVAEVTVTNISADISFTDIALNLKFATNQNGRIWNPNIITVSPSSLHDEDFSSEPDSSVVTYKIDHFQPGTSYLLQYTSLAPAKVKYPLLHLTSNQTVTATQRSLPTWLAKNYVFVNLISVALCTCLIIMYLINLKPQTKQP